MDDTDRTTSLEEMTPRIRTMIGALDNEISALRSTKKVLMNQNKELKAELEQYKQMYNRLRAEVFKK